MNVVILAAGYATRLYPLTKERPKGLLSLAGAPILDYIMAQIEAVDEVKKIYLVSNSRFAGQFRAWAEAHEAAGKRRVEVLDDGCQTEEEKLGALGDLDFCLRKQPSLAEDPLLVLAADNLFSFSLREMARRYRAMNQLELGPGAMLVGSAPPPDEDMRRFAVAQVAEDGRVRHLEEKPEQPQGETIVYAIYFYHPRALALLPQYLAEGGAADAPGHFPSWLYRRLPVYLQHTTADCLDIGTPEAYAGIQARVAEEPELLRAFAGKEAEPVPPPPAEHGKMERSNGGGLGR